jgi:hypothetical protein
MGILMHGTCSLSQEWEEWLLCCRPTLPRPCEARELHCFIRRREAMCFIYECLKGRSLHVVVHVRGRVPSNLVKGAQLKRAKVSCSHTSQLAMLRLGYWMGRWGFSPLLD